MRTLSIDIETRCLLNLRDVGVYRYVSHPSFKVLIFAWAFDDEEVQDVATDGDLAALLPEEVKDALTDPNIIKKAFNAQFERVAIGEMLGVRLDPRQWRCTMVYANILGIGGTLGKIAKYVGADEEKDTAGTALIRYFSLPKPRSDEFRTPEDDMEKWEKFREYCRQDVRSERDIGARLAAVAVPESEWENYAIDQDINDRGALMDLELAENAVRLREEFVEEAIEDAKRWTGLENPNSIQQLKGWLAERGHELDSLSKKKVEKLLALPDLDRTVRKVLENRLNISKTSVTKYQKMLDIANPDKRARGMIQFYGATKTGRFAGRLVQIQNLPKNKMPDLDDARRLVKQGDLHTLELVYDDVMDVLSQLIRTAFVAKPGHTLLVSDFSAIEARVIAWYAGEQWRLDVFANGGDIYVASASAMFKIPEDKIDDELRSKGKVSELACGYQGGPGALKAMGAEAMGLKEHELQPIINQWRAASPNIVQLWYDVQDLAIRAVRDGGVQKGPKGLKFYVKQGYLFINLPSGRRLAYANPKIVMNKFGRDAVQFDGLNIARNMAPEDTYGGKLVENIVQATARDLLCGALARLEERGYPVIFHVHDEAVAEVPNDGKHSIEEMNEIMAEQPAWAEGLPLNSDGYETPYYIKD